MKKLVKENYRRNLKFFHFFSKKVVPQVGFPDDVCGNLPADTLVVPGGVGATRVAHDPVYTEYVHKRFRQKKTHSIRLQWVVYPG